MFANWTNDKPYTSQDKPLAVGAPRKPVAAPMAATHDADRLAWEGYAPQTEGTKAVTAYRAKHGLGRRA